MTVGSTAGFAETGVLVVDKELISYSRKTPTTFLGLSRGYARMHADGVPAVVGGCIATLTTAARLRCAGLSLCVTDLTAS